MTESRAARHAALGDPARLAMIDALCVSDRTPSELQAVVGLPSNLVAHHLDTLERVGFISRSRSSGDGRRRYVHLERTALSGLIPGAKLPAVPALFICTHNSARSQLAAALWRRLADAPAESAGTHPAERVHPEAMAAAARVGLDLSDDFPRRLDEIVERPVLVVTVCDRAHEELDAEPGWLHWSIVDPVPVGTPAAFDDALDELRGRITAVVTAEPAA